MPLYRRLPKKGFSNHPFRVRFEGVNVGDLEAAFPAGSTVDLEALRGALPRPEDGDASGSSSATARSPRS